MTEQVNPTPNFNDDNLATLSDCQIQPTTFRMLESEKPGTGKDIEIPSPEVMQKTAELLFGDLWIPD